MAARTKARTAPTRLPKAPSGITGLDEITGGGLPRGRPTLICGSAGCGKTLMAMEFLVRGALAGDPGVFVAFEETAEELATNVRSIGFHLDDLIAQERIRIDHVRVERSEIEETGEYDLDGLFIRLGHAIASIGASRVVLDTIESLFSGLENTAVLRAELRRLFRWLKDRGVTTVITGERGEGQLTRFGLEEYVSDCVIFLDHRVTEQLSTRRLRIVKYRGTTHGTNEYPFLIDEDGISVLPVTSMALGHDATEDRVPSGLPELDRMLGAKGFYRTSSILVTGSEGTGKSSLAAHFLDAACRRGERALLFAFEESERQLVRNMRTIGVDLDRHIDSGMLLVHSARPTLQGLEAHLVAMHKAIAAFAPRVIAVDPISSLMGAGIELEVQSMLLRMVDFIKSSGMTALLTALTGGPEHRARKDVAISSFIDTWIQMRDTETRGIRHNSLLVLKSRGMSHSREARPFTITHRGIRLSPSRNGKPRARTAS